MAATTWERSKMTMSVTYGVFCGQTVVEERGGVERIYVPDTLGSTAMLMDTSGNVTDTFEYWPYGEERTRAVTTQTPFRFVGTLGYYTDAVGRLYVRARSYLAGLARWLTVDQFWPDEPAYTYVRGQSTLWADPTGLRGQGHTFGGRGATAVGDNCAAALRLSDPNVLKKYNECAAGSKCPPLTPSKVACLQGICLGMSGIWGLPVVIHSNDQDPDCEGNCGYGFRGSPVIVLCPDQLCTSGCDHFGTGAPFHLVLLHEALHKCGVDHPEGIPPERKCNNIMSCCILKATGALPSGFRCR